MSLDEHAAWFTALVSESAEVAAPVEVSPTELPIGAAVRLVETYVNGEVHVLYLFDQSDLRSYLVCGSTSLPSDHWLPVAESIEPLVVEPDETAPPSVPDDAVAWSEVEGFASSIPVSEDAVMRAWCDRALWIELSDGSFEEQVECRLTDDPVDRSETQGERPSRRLLLDGGECEWLSDFWTAYDGSEVWATRWWVIIEPDGRVTGTAEYAPELLECEGG
jgi:hypothetical protein